ncbi:hypothetical protein ACQEVI_08810 [Promicromonospora sp. CA-289599]|uniref:hypothetical protein n=1 Tax=Promicromonospora sp. CA-289599 TaxID=3240014 RepID=UPI003D8AA46E
MAQNPSDSPEATGPTSTGPAAAQPTPASARWRPDWRDLLKRLIGVVAVIVAVWLIYLFLDAFLPRWWAQVIGNAVDGSFTAGAWWGLLTGAVFTLAPVLLLAQAVLTRKSWQVRSGYLMLAVLLAVPNLLTLGIVLGTSAAAHAGERILDVDGPAFRGGTAWGAVIGGLVALTMVTMSVLYRRRGTQLKQLRAKQN